MMTRENVWYVFDEIHRYEEGLGSCLVMSSIAHVFFFAWLLLSAAKSDDLHDPSHDCTACSMEDNRVSVKGVCSAVSW